MSSTERDDFVTQLRDAAVYIERNYNDVCDDLATAETEEPALRDLRNSLSAHLVHAVDAWRTATLTLVSTLQSARGCADAIAALRSS